MVRAKLDQYQERQKGAGLEEPEQGQKRAELWSRGQAGTCYKVKNNLAEYGSEVKWLTPPTL